MARKILLWAALVLCEAVMIAAFILLCDGMRRDVMILDIAVSTVILGLLFIDILRPWGDENTAKLGSMGVRWTVTFIYIAASIGLMIALRDSGFTLQLLVQCGLVALLLLGMAGSIRTMEQIGEVRNEEHQMVDDRDTVVRAWTELLSMMDSKTDFPDDVRERTRTLVRDMRYLVPTNNPDAQNTDRQLKEGAESLMRTMGDYGVSKIQMEQILSQCERLMKLRRTQYSN